MMFIVSHNLKKKKKKWVTSDEWRVTCVKLVSWFFFEKNRSHRTATLTAISRSLASRDRSQGSNICRSTGQHGSSSRYHLQCFLPAPLIVTQPPIVPSYTASARAIRLACIQTELKPAFDRGDLYTELRTQLFKATGQNCRYSDRCSSLSSRRVSTT